MFVHTFLFVWIYILKQQDVKIKCSPITIWNHKPSFKFTIDCAHEGHLCPPERVSAWSSAVPWGQDVREKLRPVKLYCARYPFVSRKRNFFFVDCLTACVSGEDWVEKRKFSDNLWAEIDVFQVKKKERKDINSVALGGVVPIKPLVFFFIDSKKKAPERGQSYSGTTVAHHIDWLALCT